MTPAGLVQNAVMYSVILHSGALHFYKTGPGWRDVSRSGFQKMITNWVIKRQKAKIGLGEDELSKRLQQGKDVAQAEIIQRLDHIDEVELILLPRLDHTKVKIKSSKDGTVQTFEAVGASRFESVRAFFEDIGTPLTVT